MRKRAAALCLSLCLLLSAGCSRTEEPQSEYLLAMDTVMTLTAYGEHSETGLAAAADLIRELEELLSVTDQDSAVARLNRTGELEPVDGHLADLLDLALELGERTGGALDITVYPVVQAWGFTGDSFQVPDQETLDGLLALVDWSAVDWDGDRVTLPQGAQVDFGALAKGYAGTLAAAALKEAGVTSALLDLGGNIQTVGTKPDGSPWRIGIRDPEDPESGSYLGELELVDQAAVTSGGYQRYFEEDGETYWHIIDPATGWPARSGLTSVTVVGTDGALCDGLSTALFVLGLDEALDYWRTWGGFEAVLVGEDGTVTVTAGLADSFTLTGEGYTLTVAQ